MVIGSDENELFGCYKRDGTIILSASYEARKFGVKSAMPVFKAKQLCSKLVFAKSDYKFYKELSNKFYEILYSYTPNIEKYSIDEFFVDIVGTRFVCDPLNFAQIVQTRIKDELGLECSISISDSKSIAKLTTDLVKPFGIGKILVSQIDEKLKDICISKFPGVGKQTLKFLNEHGIYTIPAAKNAKFIFEKLGKHGVKLYDNIAGISKGEIQKRESEKSISIARTFEAQNDRSEVKRRIFIICRHLCYKIYKKNLHPTKFEIKIRYTNKKSYSHSSTDKRAFYERMLNQNTISNFEKCDTLHELGIVYLSIKVGGFLDEESHENSLFGESLNEKTKAVDMAVLQIRQKHGINLLKNAKELK